MRRFGRFVFLRRETGGQLVEELEVLGLEVVDQLPNEELLVVDRSGRRVVLIFKERLPFVLVELLPLPNTMLVRTFERGRLLGLRKIERGARLVKEPGTVCLPVAPRNAPQKSKVVETVMRDHGANGLRKDAGGAAETSDGVVRVTLSTRDELGVTLDVLNGSDDS
jgi:hypothetical protein